VSEFSPVRLVASAFRRSAKRSSRTSNRS
jgi:hypothetical protein